MAFIRKFKTTTGATGVQVCWKQNSKVVKTVHIGTASSEVGVERLVEKGREIMRGEGQRALFDMKKVKE